MSAEDIGFRVESTAKWRRSKAVQFPEDMRNLRAAEELERLAREIEALESSKVYEQINDAEESLLEACEVDDYLFVNKAINEAVSAELRSVGFHGGSDGAQFLEWYRDLLREKLQEALNPEPDLHAQAEKDPSVQAAKQAYEVAYAKALAEAGGKVT